jgi:hypothetical protein
MIAEKLKINSPNKWETISHDELKEITGIDTILDILEYDGNMGRILSRYYNEYDWNIAKFDRHTFQLTANHMNSNSISIPCL